MTTTPYQLKDVARVIFDPSSSPAQLRNTVHELHRLFVNAGALNAYSKEHEKASYLEHGFAIAPAGAAMCLLEFMRTTMYARGLKAAIEAQLERNPGTPVNILYAGCGPYALLALLVAPFFTPGQVQFSLLEIHEVALDSAKQLVACFNLENYFAAYFLDDAIHFSWPEDKPMHILLTETMTAALKNEAQVAITLHLAPQLAPGGVLVPEAVAVDLVLTHRGYHNDVMMGIEPRQIEGQPIHTLAHLITLDKQTAITHKNSRYPFPPVTVHVPDGDSINEYAMELRTLITVYKDHKLNRQDCSLTVPRRVKNSEQLPCATAEWVYDNGPQPGFTFKVVAEGVLPVK